MKSIKPIYYWLVSVAATLLVLLVTLYISHVNYVEKLSNRHSKDIEQYRFYNLEEMVKRTGHFILPPRQLSFINFLNKEKKKKRIGVFGDSYTYGDEVKKGQTYPVLLQLLLGQDYQVINFGMSWYSLDQSFILFKEYYEEFKLDKVILGPRGIFRYRTETFNHTNDRDPYYIHSRFVIESKDGEDTIVEKRPKGQNLLERFERYYSFVPEPMYLIYDSRAPSFIRSLEYWFNAKFVNPFYYYKDYSPEVEKIHSIILKSFIDTAKDGFLFIHNRFEGNELAKSQSWTNSSHKNLQELEREGFPWVARNGHYSGFGNATIALQVYALLKEREYVAPRLTVAGDYKNWDDKIVEVYLGEHKVGALSKELANSGHVVGFHCLGQNVGNTLFYATDRNPETKKVGLGFNQIFNGEWLTVYQRTNCRINYSRKALITSPGEEKSDLVINNSVVAKIDESSVIGGKEVIFFNDVHRITIDNASGEDLLNNNGILLEIR